MSIIAKPYNFTSGTTIVSAQVNSDFDTLYTDYNGGITNANISASAAIGTTKISGTAANLSDTQSFTGAKTFTKTVQTIATATDGATVTFDLSAGNIQQVTLGGNRTLALSNVSTGQVFILRIVQSTGSNTVSWFSTIKWSGGTAPTLSTAASAVDLFGFICTGSNTYDGVVIAQNLS